MQTFILKPIINMFSGVRVDKDTVLDYKNENVEQKIENLVMHSVTKTKSEEVEGVYDLTIKLSEGDVLIFEEERGYIKPRESFVTITEAIEDLTSIGGE